MQHSHHTNDALHIVFEWLSVIKLPVLGIIFSLAAKDVEVWVRIIVLLLTGCFTVWQWYTKIQDRKEEKQKQKTEQNGKTD